MCLIGFSWQPDSCQRLLVAANRDEFHARPTAPVSRWGDAHACYAGRDLQAGGTWLAVGTDGRFAAVTNVREPGLEEPRGRSRGCLVADFMARQVTAPDYADEVWRKRDEFAGFNLLLADRTSCLHLSNRDAEVHRIRPGVHALSNATLDTPWPKTDKAIAALDEAAGSDEPSVLWSLLQDRTIAADPELPSTGVPLDWERRLSAPFILGEEYGTRSSTILSISDDQIEMEERRFDAEGKLLGRTMVCSCR